MPEDQLGFLRLLSSLAHQQLSYYGSPTSDMEIVAANGDTFKAPDEQLSKEKVSRPSEHSCCSPYMNPLLLDPLCLQLSDSRTTYVLSGEPDLLPIVDFATEEGYFGFDLGRACFCNSLP